MIINIPTNSEKIFLQYLTIINGILSSEKKLAKIELLVLDKFLYIDYLYKDLDKDKRNKILFNEETKKRIRVSLDNMSEASLNNVISKLRKKGMISDRELKVKIPLKDNKIELGFRLELNGE